MKTFYAEIIESSNYIDTSIGIAGSFAWHNGEYFETSTFDISLKYGLSDQGLYCTVGGQQFRYERTAKAIVVDNNCVKEPVMLVLGKQLAEICGDQIDTIKWEIDCDYAQVEYDRALALVGEFGKNGNF